MKCLKCLISEVVCYDLENFTRNFTISLGIFFPEARERPSKPGEGLTSKTRGPPDEGITSTPAMGTDKTSVARRENSITSEGISLIGTYDAFAPKDMLCLCSLLVLLIHPSTSPPSTKTLKVTGMATITGFRRPPSTPS